MEILIKKFKENSHIPIEKIKEMQHRHAKDIIQPRDSEGELNPQYLKEYNCKNLNISDHDLKRAAEKYPRTILPIVEQEMRRKEEEQK